MALKKVKFLLDENMPIKLKSVFTSLELSCVTVRDLKWFGIRNGNLSIKVKEGSYILITRDKDFVFLWDKYEIQVIFLAIEPPLLSSLVRPLESLLQNWSYNLCEPFLITLTKDSIRLRQ